MKPKLLSGLLIVGIVLISGCVEQGTTPKENVTHRFDKGLKIIDFKRFSAGSESCGGMAIEVKSELENPINVSSLRLYADDVEIGFVIASEGAMGITTELECVLYPNKTITLWNSNLGCTEKELTEPKEQPRTGIVVPAGTVVKVRGEFPNKLRVEVGNYYSEVSNIRPLRGGHDVVVSVVPWTISCKPVTIATDKTEYEPGEEVRASVMTNQVIYTGWGPWQLLKYENGSWKSVIIRCWCSIGCDQNETECGYQIQCAPPWPGCHQVNATEIKTWSWDQEICVWRPINCTSQLTNETEPWMCTEYQASGPGRYKLKFTYTTSCPVKDSFGRDATVQSVEIEFTIKL